MPRTKKNTTPTTHEEGPIIPERVERDPVGSTEEIPVVRKKVKPVIEFTVDQPATAAPAAPAPKKYWSRRKKVVPVAETPAPATPAPKKTWSRKKKVVPTGIIEIDDPLPVPAKKKTWSRKKKVVTPVAPVQPETTEPEKHKGRVWPVQTFNMYVSVHTRAPHALGVAIAHLLKSYAATPDDPTVTP